jgi:hypothetical protein
MSAAGWQDVTPSEACLYSTVQNITEVEMSFGFLGDHGRRLAPAQAYSVRGNIIDYIAKDPRKFEAFERAVAGFTDQNGNAVAPTLALLATPAQFLYDPTRHTTKVATLINGVLGFADGCWGAQSSEGYEAPPVYDE